MATTFDGASVNRRLVKIHSLGSHDLVYKVHNPYASEERYLYFFSDPPHLMKTVRNAWASPKCHLWVSVLYAHVHMYICYIVSECSLIRLLCFSVQGKR